MTRPSRVIAAAALAATTIIVAAAGTAAHASGRPDGRPGPAVATVPGSVAPFATASQVTGAVPGGEPADDTALAGTADRGGRAVRRRGRHPGQPGSFRRFLSPAAYTARFGATAATAASVGAWLRSAGFTGVSRRRRP